MVLRKDTHYDAVDLEMSWFEKKTRKRINFTLFDKDLVVTFYWDMFPLFPRMSIWCHHYIPMFSMCAKIYWRGLDRLALGESDDYYRQTIKTYVHEVRRLFPKETFNNKPCLCGVDNK